jgi:hypothetical protein
VGTTGCSRRRRRRLPMADEEETHTHLMRDVIRCNQRSIRDHQRS